MMVSPARRISSAISFGVFRRLAASIRPMIRSRNDSPGLAVMRTTIQSERTRVPPVTELRSPPLSRITGALSPVTALSSTEATPSMISPSPGISWLACTNTMSPARKLLAATFSKSRWSLGFLSFLARMSRRALRSVSACALPRPSAIASAKLANNTVNHSQIETPRMNHGFSGRRPLKASTARMLVSRLPTSTTNITGFRTTWRGFSFRNASSTARRTIGP